jgi:phosphoglycerol transferase MdoB-like AlkP superfamily enzyme
MRAASLLLLFLMAKSAVLFGHPVPFSFWAAAAYIWQDILAALLFAALEAVLPSRASAAVYWALALYAAINVPVGRAVSSPLTWPMLRAARGPLADSILLYVTWTNCLLILLILLAAAVLPKLFRRAPLRAVRWAAAGLVPFLLLGPFAGQRVDTHGLDRNPLLALVDSGMARAEARTSAGNWRTSRFPGAPAEDLSRFSAIAKGSNVIMLSLESTAAQYLSLYGSGYDVMPNLGAMAQRAVVFENAYAVYPESIKGLFSVLCSVFPERNSEPEVYRNWPCRSVAQVLADQGYRTAMFHSGRFAYLGMESIIQNRGFSTLEDAGDIGGNHNSSFGVDEPAAVARILAWLDTLPKGQRFFVTYLPIAGHHPYATAERGPFPIHSEVDSYRNALHYGDISIGALMDGLRQRGLDRNTIWVIYGDHGEAFHQHEGNYGHTFYVYEENVHVPFLIAAPGLLREQTRVRKVVSLVDTAPTLLDLLGIAVPEGYQGRSMLDGASRMALFFTDYSLGILGLRDGPWKFLYETESRRGRLFDLESDPGETRDRSAQQRERAAWYEALLRQWGRI